MSLYYGAYVGMGYLLSEAERVKLLEPVVGTDMYDAITENFYPYGDNKWFFGEVLHEMESGEAKSIETLAGLTRLENPDNFAIKYGTILSACGRSVEEINTVWSTPNLYFIFYENYY